MYVLGINAYHADSAACLIKDGKLVAAIEEERIRRVKHWAGFPSESIKFCLDFAGIRIQDVSHIALNRDPKANYWKKIWFVLKNLPSFRSLWNRFVNKRKVVGVKEELAKALGIKESQISAKFYNISHHLAHLASAFFVSPFEEAALLSVDGMGDFSSAMWGVGEGNKMKILGEINYPDSIGFFYTAITQFLGFWKFGDEYKVMGLAAFGKPKYLKEMREIVRIKLDRGSSATGLGANNLAAEQSRSAAAGIFELSQEYFLHAKGEVKMAWEGGYPELSKLYSNKLEDLLGPSREESAELTQKHKDIAASAQAIYEEVFFALLNKLHKETRSTNLCFAGGTAQNSLANGQIFKNSPFKEVFIQPAGYDAGGALGAAFYVWNQILNKERNFTMVHSYWGPEYHNGEIKSILDANIRTSQVLRTCDVQELGETMLIQKTAQLLAEGKIVGWFQGRTEWGPRALGNRSILANPARPDMKDILNLKIKKRESFRPFAPSILEEYVSDYFLDPRGAEVVPPGEVRPLQIGFPAVPFMEKVYTIKPEMRAKIPAVTHADGTGRLQTVSKKENPLYWQLIDAFRQITGVPILLNTSFNENEPIVNKPQEAIDCFLRTKMDVLVLENFILVREI
ncbi:MAG: carbamoyltransferase [Candidatus Liptonbacteria bacterium]|nr:carbamoyltransferase [Candidatus Liptonbacteria bacterium]